ncbi:MAG: hypothetical protein N4A45_08765 [Flavobacteriales bacterium]|jgi:hypothetical protein|nr:hypothetical protein [Flavobacteriales bacterium]
MNVVEYIFHQILERVKRILPEREIQYMPDVSGIYSSYRALTDLVFVTERYLQTKVLPIKWKIIKSSQLKTEGLSKKSKENYESLITHLEEGDINVNSNSLGFIPKSSKRYFDTFEGDNEKWRYRVDFTNQIFGIRHFHLDNHNTREDSLLYYVTVNDVMYFLSIGGHNDLYTDRNLKILIHEFDFLLPVLGIASMPDMPFGENPNYSIDDVRKMWVSGLNVSFIINDKYYTSTKLQTFSRVNTEIIRIIQNIYYQIQTGLKEHIEENSNTEIIVSENQNFENLKNGIIKLEKMGVDDEFEISVDYLRILPLIDYLIENMN